MQQLSPANAARQLAAILEASDDAVLGVAQGGTIFRWSEGAARLFGYGEKEIVGQSLRVLAPPERAAETEKLLEKIARGEACDNFETVRLTKDGSRREVRLSRAPLRDENGEVAGAMIVLRDITARLGAERVLFDLEAEARESAVVLQTANRVALDILSSRTGVEALRHIAEAARVLASARYAALGVAREDGAGLQQFIAVGLTPEEESAIGTLPCGRGVLGLLLERSTPLRLENLAQHPAFAGFPPHHPPMKSFLGVPIRRGETVLGSLYLTDKQGGGPFTAADETAVQALGDHAAVAIHHVRLLKRQRALVANLLSAQEEERRAVAYDLHDGLTQYVMASYAHLDAFARAQAAQRDEKAADEWRQGLKFLKEAVLESRRMISGLRLMAMDDLGLAGALDELLREERERAGWPRAEFFDNVERVRFDRMLETVIYRIAQESLTNARRHAGTPRVEMKLMCQESRAGVPQLSMEVRDWGCGFVPQDRIGAPGHIGLAGIIERAHLLDGTVELRSAPGQGTVLCARFSAPAPRVENESASTRE